MTIDRISAADVAVSITAPVAKLCPVKQETDYGTVAIRYRTHGQAFELHALAKHLASFAGQALSHEDFTQSLANELGANVTSVWQTAGMEVECHAVLREPVNAESA